MPSPLVCFSPATSLQCLTRRNFVGWWKISWEGIFEKESGSSATWRSPKGRAVLSPTREVVLRRGRQFSSCPPARGGISKKAFSKSAKRFGFSPTLRYGMMVVKLSMILEASWTRFSVASLFSNAGIAILLEAKSITCHDHITIIINPFVNLVKCYILITKKNDKNKVEVWPFYIFLLSFASQSSQGRNCRHTWDISQ